MLITPPSMCWAGFHGGWRRRTGVGLESGAGLNIQDSGLEYGAREYSGLEYGVRSLRPRRTPYWSPEFESGADSGLGSGNRAPYRTPDSNSGLRTGGRNLRTELLTLRPPSSRLRTPDWKTEFRISRFIEIPSWARQDGIWLRPDSVLASPVLRGRPPP